MPVGLIVTLCGLLALLILRRERLTLNRSLASDLLCAFLGLTGIMAVVIQPVFSLGASFFIDGIVAALSRVPHFQIHVHSGSGLLDAALAYFIFSFFQYWNHRALHSRWLWPLHRFHHSGTVFSPFLSLRLHPAELTVSPLFMFWMFFLFGFPASTAFAVTIIHRLVGFLSHSDKNWKWAAVGSWVLMAPGHHWIHHSAEPEHFNRNFSVLPIWDHLFGTWYDGDRINTEIGIRPAVHNQRFFMWEWFSDLRDLVPISRKHMRKTSDALSGN